MAFKMNLTKCKCSEFSVHLCYLISFIDDDKNDNNSNNSHQSIGASFGSICFCMVRRHNTT